METRIVRDEFLRLRAGGHPVVFTLDFLSTSRDLFYTIAKDHETNPPELIDRWLERKGERMPHCYIDEEPTGIDSPVSKNWIFRTFDRVPSVIYEVGDDTDRDLVRGVATVSAETLMELLVEYADRGGTPASVP